MKKYLWILLATVSVAALVGCADQPKSSACCAAPAAHSSYDK